MQQIQKANRPLQYIICMLLSTLLFLGCNNDAAKTDEEKTDSTTPAMTAPADTLMAPADTLPPLDTTATTRPETRKAH
jgi:hypothetical protein